MNLRFSFFLFLCVFGLNLLQAQTNSTFGNIKLQEIPYGLQGTMQAIYPGPDGTAYAMTSHKGAVATVTSAQTLKAHRMDKDFNYVETIEIQNVKFFPALPNGGIAFFPLRGKVFVTYVDQDKDAIVLNITEIENSANPVSLGRFSKSERTKAELYEKIQSPNGKNMAIVLKVETIDSVLSYIVAFDDQMIKKGQYRLGHEESTGLKKFAINDEGVILCVDVSDNDPGKKEEKLLKYKFRLLQDGKVIKTKEVNNIKEDGFTGQLLALGQSFFVDILTDHKEEVSIKNSNGKSKIETQDKYTLYHMELGPDLSLIKDVKSKISKSTIDKIKQGDKLYGSVISFKGTFPMADGSIMLIGDASNSHEGYWKDFQGGPALGGSSIYKQPSWEYTGIMMMRVDPNGMVSEIKSEQRDAADIFYFLLPVVPVKVKDGVVFSYFDFGKDIHLIKAFLDANGKILTKEKIFDWKSMDGRAIVQESLVSDGSNTVYAVIDHPNKKAEVAKFVTE